MERQYVALLRAISNVGMERFREGMEALGFADVASYGMSGNLLFNAGSSDTEAMEHRIAERFNTAAFVRTHEEMAKIVAEDPFNSGVLFLARPPGAVQRRAFLDLEFETPTPVLRGTTIYVVAFVIDLGIAFGTGLYESRIAVSQWHSFSHESSARASPRRKHAPGIYRDSRRA